MKVKINARSENLPDFLIVGAAKSGTTSLYYYLRDHPEVFMSSPKEPYFFTYMGQRIKFSSPEKFHKIYSNLKDYLKLFYKVKRDQMIGEASVTYLLKYNQTIKNLKKVYGNKCRDIKIIIMLRNPADRMWSQYNHFKRDLNEPLPFDKAIRPAKIKQRMSKNPWNPFYDYIKAGEYFESVKEYLKNFKNVKIIFFEEFKEDTESVVNDVYQFLSVDNSFITPKGATNQVYNRGGQFRDELKFFLPFYRRFIDRKGSLRKITRKFVSLKIRSKIDEILQNFSLKRRFLSRNLTKKIIREYYEEDLKKLMTLLKDEKKQKILADWRTVF